MRSKTDTLKVQVRAVAGSKSHMLLKTISCDPRGVPLGATLGATGANEPSGDSERA